MSIAWSIVDGTVNSSGYGTVQDWPADRIANGDWGAVQFLSPYLCAQFAALRRGELGAVALLGTIADIGPEGRRIRDAFTRSEMPDEHGRPPGHPPRRQADQSAPGGKILAAARAIAAPDPHSPEHRPGALRAA